MVILEIKSLKLIQFRTALYFCDTSFEEEYLIRNK